MASSLLLRQDGPVLWVTLNRPERLNALDPDLVDALRALFTDLYWRHDIRVVVLEGAGRAFCAGLDLKAPRERGAIAADRGLALQRLISEIVVAMRRCPQPIIGLLQGAASGGGLGLALACDVRLATDDLRMNAAFIRIGLSGCDIGVSYFLPRMVGSSVAAELLLTGDFITAVRAETLGLVSRIVPPEGLRPAALDLCDAMLAATPMGLRLTKEALNTAIDAPGLEAVIAMEDRNQILCAVGPDFREGVDAFLQKRRPAYRPTPTPQEP